MRAAPVCVLGALLAAGCAGSSGDAGGPPLRTMSRAVDAEAPGPDITVNVSAGAVGVNATVLTAHADAPLFVALLSPDGSIAASGAEERPGAWSLATIEPPAPGAWSLAVATRPGYTVDYRANVTVLYDKPTHETLDRDVAANASVEVDLVLDAGDAVTFAFESARPVAWNVHSHRGDAVVTWRAGNASRLEGLAFTATERGAYSLMLSASPVAAHVRVTGAFRVARVVER